ncbi:TonB-dependent receptor [Chitinophaga japonensis]|uniref:Outer membrane receptor protein involved in Fe transport n=1 Tax=Chitinophaga japonensis TaxID=104662 RepID=A0A562T6J9_CHIJA|nr:TonB-dependent receptor [Chitinophaga japonensis]TWI89167.1 outer membrane receptor protein involved in Fe transport [Chitinophaga japonensis]
MIRSILSGLFLLFLCQLLHAQSKPQGKITIRITDKEHKPQAFANVLVRQVKDSSLVKGELSDEQGNATFDNIPGGRYFVQATLLGYAPAYSAPFTIDAAHKTIALNTLQLLPQAKNLQAINVTAQKPFIERGAGKTTLNVESSIAAAGSNVLDLLRKAPGVTIDKDDNILVKGNQGVTVMIDGKLTYLSGEQLSNLLKSTPSETVSQIEIITTPGAKYDAAGNSGIINIKTRKGQLTGINGTVNASMGLGRYPIYNAGGNFNWRTSKFNLFGNYNYGDRRFFTRRQLWRHIAIEDPMLFHQQIFQRNRFTNNTFKAGMDYFISKQHTVGVLVNGYANAFRNSIYSGTSIGNPAGRIDSILNTLTTNNNRFRNVAVNLNYKGQLDTIGTEISVDADYARFHNNRRLNLSDSLFDTKLGATRNANAIRNHGQTNVTIKSIKADLVLPLGKHSKVEAGVKAAFVETDNRLAYDSLINKEYVPALSQSDRFIYQENILAAYGTYKLEWKKIDLQAGLRLEKTISDANSLSLQSRIERSYLNLFPSLSADYKLSEDHKLGLSYSRRIERPGYNGLNPFLFFLDKYTYFRGNPYLRPEYTDNTELSYTFKQKYILTTGYSYTRDVINEYLYQDDSTKITTSTNLNYNNRQNYSLSLTLPFEVTKWWSSSNSLNMYYNRYSLNTGASNVENSKVEYYFNTTNTFTLPHDMKAELGGYYYSPFIEGIFSGQAQYDINLGLQKALLDKKATVKFNVSNIIRRGSQFIGYAKYDNVDTRIRNTWNTTTYTLSISYRFGNTNIKGARERQTGSSEELKRAG